MSKKTSLKWQGADQVARQMTEYERKVNHAVMQVAQYFAPVIETAAKEGAPWLDRTANARQSLHAYVMQLSRDTVRLYLSHGVEYGVHLETGYAGRYQIIWPTLEEHIPQIRAMLQGIFK
jgi:hypothetical protein